MSRSGPTIAIVGATGAVGREALDILCSWSVPAERVTAVASPRSAGGRVAYGGASLTLAPLETERLAEHDIVVCCTPAEVSRAAIPAIVARGGRVVDASSAFRAAEDVPLVIPEVNGELLDAQPALTASPNCSTILLLTALEPIRRAFGIESITVSTYQAVSGAGAAALEELREQTAAALAGGSAAPRVFAEPCAFNCFSHDSAVDPDTGLNGEESKMIAETRKIWADDELCVQPTCVRVPVERAHGEAVWMRLRRGASTPEVRSVLEAAAGVRVVDDRASNAFPTSHAASGVDDVLVGRLRSTPAGFGSGDACRTHSLWLCGDQLRKGAALNALQIARRLAPGLGQRTSSNSGVERYRSPNEQAKVTTRLPASSGLEATR